LLQARWYWLGFLTCHALTALILASWLWTPSRQWLDALDVQVFHLLNAPLATSTLWAKIWAVGSMRLTDIGAGCIMLAFIIKDGWIFTGAQVRRALYAFLSVLVLLLLIRAGPFAELVKLMHWQHSSPSLVVAGAVRLAELFPAWDAVWHIKDSSVRSFPGDHASVLLLWVLFLWPYAAGRQRLLISGLSVLLLLPRLVSGAHWSSDLLIAGTAVRLPAFGWGFCTPFAAKAADLLERLSAPVLKYLGRLPGLRRISLISGH
jgi:membrane-associated phospholipid phosphatase